MNRVNRDGEKNFNARGVSYIKTPQAESVEGASKKSIGGADGIQFHTEEGSNERGEKWGVRILVETFLRELKLFRD